MGYPMAFSAMQKQRRSGQKHLSTIAATSIVAGGSLLPIFPAAAADTCTATDLNSLQLHARDIDCAIINVTSNINFSEGDYRVVVTHDTLIQGSVTIDANGFGEHFIIADDYDGFVYDGDINNNGSLDVTLKNLVLREGAGFSETNYFSYNSLGGSVTQGINSMPVNLTIDSVDFIDNSSANSGGAIYIREGFIDVKNASTFVNNESDNGGAIHIQEGTGEESVVPVYLPSSNDNGIVISGNSIFSGNSALDGDGGAIWSQTGVTITGTATFTDNNSIGEGGAISSVTTIVSNTGDVTFDENSAGTYGGAIGYLFFGEGIVDGESIVWVEGEATFTNNFAGAGGAVATWALFGLAESNMVFDNNQALASNGGAIAAFGVVFGVYVGGYANDKITNVEFTNNTAEEDGGAIWAPIIISDRDNSLIFRHNHSGDDGGAIYSSGYGAPYQFSNSYFGYNSAEGDGGAIFASERVFVRNSTFFNNTAGFAGGAIFAGQDGSEVILSTFVNNQAALDGKGTSGQSIYTNGNFKLFGNIFASELSNLAHFGEDDPGDLEIVDLGANLSTSTDDELTLSHKTSRIVSYPELTLASSPASDPNYQHSAPVIQISTDSAAADIIDLSELEESIVQLTLELDALPTVDQRGASRTFKYDAGSYEAGESTLRPIAPILEIINKVVLPAAPARVAVKPNGKAAFSIEWPIPTTPGTGKITGYEIYRNGKKIATVSPSTRKYRDKNLDPNQSYTYRIVTIATQGKSIKSISSPSLFPKK